MSQFKLQHKFGLGGVAIGNGFKELSDAEAEKTLEAAWEAGVRYYDTSPWYGLGLSERRFGHFLHNKKREEYVLSTKVGRILKATKNVPEVMWKNPSPFDYKYDYSAEAVRRSVEDSLQRLGVESIDYAFPPLPNWTFQYNWRRYLAGPGYRYLRYVPKPGTLISPTLHNSQYLPHLKLHNTFYDRYVELWLVENLFH